ncbi:C-factor-like [Thrips palmi]|uniref:C-factor-like n=1 Tax=Thrips palmi TaxID=161013 RepID=A0A6P9AAY3_THRPL|nr:C-factor-like [Thrips palmi]XP_034253206.1 C-factor-like [Thrips palmi]
MSSVLITGSSRGLGLEFVKQLLAHPKAPSVLIAACRKPDNASELQSLAKAHSNLHVVQFDVNDFDSYDAFTQKVASIVGEKGLNVLINNAGIMKGKKDSLSDFNAKDMMDTLTTNYIAPVLLIKAMRPLLKLAADSNKNLPIGWSRAAAINITSYLGSLAENTFGTFLEYRESKAALNMAARSIAVELAPDNIFVLSMHPGWVQTDMGTSEAPLTKEDSISGMLKVFYSLKPEQHGTFVQWDGKVLPW